MAEPAKNDAHIVEIPVSVDGGEAEAARSLEKAAAGGAHPLGEIATSAGHLLLLKLWQREEDRLGRRACALEARMDAARRDAFYLCPVPRLPRPLPRGPLRRVRGRLRLLGRSRPGERRVQEVVGAAVAVPGGLPRARRGRAAPGLRLLARRGAAAPGARRRARAGPRRAGAAHEGRRVRPVQGAAVRGDEGQMRQRRGHRRVGAAPVVPAERRHRLPASRRRRGVVLRQVHPLRIGWTPKC